MTDDPTVVREPAPDTAPTVAAEAVGAEGADVNGAGPGLPADGAVAPMTEGTDLTTETRTVQTTETRTDEVAETPAFDQPAEPAAEAPSPEPAPQPPPPPASVAELIATTLRAAGVRSAFTVPGESFLPLLDALAAAGIRIIATRHENGAAFMAAAQAQLTGRPAACLATRAVGAANLAIGIHAARADSASVIAIVGDVRRDLAGRESFQEADIAGSIGTLAIASVTLDDPASLPDVLTGIVDRAISDRPGPVVIAVPEDVLLQPPPSTDRRPTPRPTLPRPADEEVRAVLQLLASAQRPIIVAGGGVLRARTSSDLVRLAELLHVPVVAAWRRADVIPNDHPLFLGMTGLGSPATVRERVERADALLVLGCRLNEVASFGYAIPAPGQPWAHVDLAPRTTAAGAGLSQPTFAIRSDARAFVRAAVVRLRSAVLDAGLVDSRRSANETDRAAWEAASIVDESAWDGPGIHPGRTIATLRRVLPDDAILTTDAGNFAGWAARGFRFRRPGTFLGPTSGAMGYGLPAAIGASLVHRDRAVVALTGDGGFAMSMAEIETAVREGLRVVVLVFDNQRYGTIRMQQDREHREPLGTDLGPIDFAAVARGLGARGVRVESDSGFEAALRQALATTDRPSVIQLALDRRWVSVDDHP
jgi:acetolactate synthase I/II/III large subunit